MVMFADRRAAASKNLSHLGVVDRISSPELYSRPSSFKAQRYNA